MRVKQREMEHEEPVQTNPIGVLSQGQLTSQQTTKCQVKWKVLTVYLFLVCGLAISCITVGVLSGSDTLVGLVRNHFTPTMVLTSLLMTLNTNIFNKIPYDTQKASKTMFWILNCVLAAIPMLNVEASLLAKSFIYTLVLFLILTLKSFIIPERVIQIYIHPLTAVHTIVLACTVFSVLFNSLNLPFRITEVIMAVCLYAGFLVYAGLLICNTHRLFLNAKQPHFDPMFTAFVFYMNVINLYSRVAVFTGRNPSKSIEGKACNTNRI